MLAAGVNQQATGEKLPVAIYERAIGGDQLPLLSVDLPIGKPDDYRVLER